MVGFEALARLTDALGNQIPPDTFIPIAEETGLIAKLGEAVLNAALDGLSLWRKRHPDARPAVVHVNLSARQAQQADMPAVVRNALVRHGLEPADLILELTESILLQAGSSAIRQLTELHRAGVGIAIDDFGTGYASLRYLAILPISVVKVDRTFTAAMLTDTTSATIVRAIAALSAEMGLSCIVEGIESTEQLAALPAGMHGQGYLLGRPAAVPSNDWPSAEWPRRPVLAPGRRTPVDMTIPTIAQAAAQRSFAVAHAVHALAVVVPVGLITGVLCYDRFMAAVRVDNDLPPTERRRTRWQIVSLAGLWTAGGAVHLGVIDRHFAENTLLGIFFLLLSVLQFGYALRLVVAPSRALIGVGLVANLAVVMLWAYTRTVDIPFGIGGRENVGLADGLAVALELGAAVLSLVLVRSAALRRVRITRRMVLTAVAIAVGVGSLAAVA